MIKKNQRNSRDDKSGSGNGRTGKRTSQNSNFRDKTTDKRERSSEGNKEYKNRDTEKEGRKPFTDSRPFRKRESPSYSRQGQSDSKNSFKENSRRPFGDDKRKSFNDDKRKSFGEDKRKSFGDDTRKPFNSDNRRESGFEKRREGGFEKRREGGFEKRPGFKGRNFSDKASSAEKSAPILRSRKKEVENDDLIRLNRYIANSGICSRRKADELIAAGVISVNHVIISELGHKVNPFKDEIRYNGELLKREKKVYVLLNKPKDYITTTDDPQERKTVMQLVEKASRERIYPVGRLDRNTTGLLLMTNDGDLADKLSHPKNGITKIYHVELDKNLSQGDFNKIEFGLELEDGIIKPDNIQYVTGASKKEIGIQIHSGKNRIVRRIFEHLGYDVVKLDRVVYGNLTKKDLPRGRWRYLDEKELIQIKHLIK
ncbi:MAG: pseudouridine synthase [Pedobacter sp.]|nr:MAG: pseudouridine synthase [Pedobacter sp.]